MRNSSYDPPPRAHPQLAEPAHRSATGHVRPAPSSPCRSRGPTRPPPLFSSSRSPASPTGLTATSPARAISSPTSASSSTPLPTKSSSSALLIALAVESHHTAPMWMVVVIAAREFLISGLRQIAAAKQKILAAKKIGKHKTVSQIVAILVSLGWLSLVELGLQDAGRRACCSRCNCRSIGSPSSSPSHPARSTSRATPPSSTNRWRRNR